MEKRSKITISFKTNELWIYDEICKHSGKGKWCKSILSKYLKGNVYSDNLKSNNVKISPPIISSTKEIDDILGGL